MEEKTSMERIGALFFELDREIKKIESTSLNSLVIKLEFHPDPLEKRIEKLILKGNDHFVQSLIQKDKEFDEKEKEGG